MLLLAIESSAKTASAALVSHNGVLAEFSVTTGLKHSQTLMPMVDALLSCAGISKEALDGFAVAIGPGSFTGLRIGVSAVKGMADGLQKPCCPISTLEGLAMNVQQFEGVVCAVMDARCGQVYNALFDVHNGVVQRLCQDRALTIDDLYAELKEKYLQKKIILVGDGANLCYNREDKLPTVQLASPQVVMQSAASIGLAAVSRFQEDKLSGDKLMPAYLRLSQAERNFAKQMRREER